MAHFWCGSSENRLSITYHFTRCMSYQSLSVRYRNVFVEFIMSSALTEIVESVCFGLKLDKISRRAISFSSKITRIHPNISLYHLKQLGHLIFEHRAPRVEFFYFWNLVHDLRRHHAINVSIQQHTCMCLGIQICSIRNDCMSNFIWSSCVLFQCVVCECKWKRFNAVRAIASCYRYCVHSQVHEFHCSTCRP